MEGKIVVFIGVILLPVLCGSGAHAQNKLMVCYFNTTNTLTPEHIDWNLCTHMIYKAAILEHSTNQISLIGRRDGSDENGYKGLHKSTLDLRKRYPRLKVLLAVGTWDDGSLKYSQMASTGTGRRRFVVSVLDTLKHYGFDGMSLDWEYPGQRGGGPEDRRNYDLLISELRIELDRQGLIFSGLLPQSRHWLESYDIESVKRNFHFICLTTYNYWGPWWDYNGIAAPLREVETSVNLYLAKKVPREMIVVGIPAYAQTGTLAYAFKNQRPQIVVGPGEEGPHSRFRGRLFYDEVVHMQRDSPSEWTVYKDEPSQSPYAVKGLLYITYDDPISVERKAHFIQRKGLGGAMIMTIDSDDHRGTGSNETTFPLTRTLHRILRGNREDE
ncbi:acidic mammalian chitinase-like [Ischnura elegans]|uniref:acidic mammalian chitinase-like n=1 Tax=Ischnura elegans TaxID=197161 RepID=UPI001ED876E1|nr:acidic mammalian chitinase-like [Ischnura elegans]